MTKNDSLPLLKKQYILPLEIGKSPTQLDNTIHEVIEILNTFLNELDLPRDIDQTLNALFEENRKDSSQKFNTSQMSFNEYIAQLRSNLRQEIRIQYQSDYLVEWVTQKDMYNHWLEVIFYQFKQALDLLLSKQLKVNISRYLWNGTNNADRLSFVTDEISRLTEQSLQLSTKGNAYDDVSVDEYLDDLHSFVHYLEKDDKSSVIGLEALLVEEDEKLEESDDEEHEA